MVKNIFNTVKNSRENVFRASASSECKKYIQLGNSVFSGQAQVAQKSWAVK